ncbi:MAG: hypothetical protein ACD_46C00308G0004 [uncultured bacterium]|nr:MAG: hypothetical protein ACD_46C00308G0004 [uncultured bacterium]
MIKKFFLWSGIFLFSLSASSVADTIDDNLGQTIQIYTRFKSFVGKPSWLLIIRDIDHNQNIPYLYDIKRGDNFWLAFTFGRNYLILASKLVFNPYKSKINNFCHLESNGRIIRGESLFITISGDLSPNTNTFNCHVLKYRDSQFTIVNHDSTQ